LHGDGGWAMHDACNYRFDEPAANTPPVESTPVTLQPVVATFVG
jgi:hypothetical protein